ncbi:MAG: NAD-binding protein [Saprospiraceae bacterium]
MHHNSIAYRISLLEGHVILCGFGKYGEEIAANLASHDTPFVIIENDPVKIDAILKLNRETLYMEETLPATKY